MADYALRLDDAELVRYRFMAQTARAEESADWAAAGFVPVATVADVGCGPGLVSEVLADVVGLRVTCTRSSGTRQPWRRRDVRSAAIAR